MKKIFFTTFLLITVALGFGQKLKYKNIFATLQSGDEILAYNQLLAYQKTHPFFANTYFQLGNLSYKWAFETDPFLDISRTEYFIYNTKLFYRLALKQLRETKNDARRNRKYYQNVPQLQKIDKLTNDDVIAFINQRLIDIEEYDKQVHKIYSYFYRMVANYNKTVNFYRSILASYESLKDIYLAPLAEINPKLKKLQVLFDSTQFLYQQYKAAITSYPIKNYNQKIKLQDILTYRLEGITNTNFLADTIFIWNYDKWGKEVRNVIISDITQLRSQIDVTQRMMDKYQHDILSGPYEDTRDFYDLKPKIIFQIEKYDYKSLMSAYFIFRKAQLDFLTYSKLKFNDTSDTKQPLLLRARNYKILRDLKLKSDSLLKIVEQRNTPAERHKFKDFFDEEFPKGFTNYLTDQYKFNADYLQKQFEHLKFFVLRDALNYTFAQDTLTYKKLQIPDFVQFIEPGQLQASTVVVLDKVKSPRGEYYLGGYVNTVNGAYPFIASINNGQVTWFYKGKRKQNVFSFVTKLFVNADGVFAIIHSRSIDGEANMLLNLDFNGKKNSSLTLDSKFMPRYFNYDDINNFYLIVSKGNEIQPLSNDTSSLVIEQWDATNKTLRWKKVLKVDGSFIDFVRIDTVYHIFFNAKKYSGLSGEQHQAKNNIIAELKIGFSGKPLGIKEIVDAPVYGIKVLKLSNRLLNLLALDSQEVSIYTTKFVNLPKLKYFLLIKN